MLDNYPETLPQTGKNRAGAIKLAGFIVRQVAANLHAGIGAVKAKIFKALA